jgi:hypothetical protein
MIGDAAIAEPEMLYPEAAALKLTKQSRNGLIKSRGSSDFGLALTSHNTSESAHLRLAAVFEFDP